MPVDRKPIFDATRSLLKKYAPNWSSYTAEDVRTMDRAIDQAIAPPSASPAPTGGVPSVQIGLSSEDFLQAALRLGCTVAQIRAVDEVESGGGWFTDVRSDILDLDGPGGFLDGPNLPKILFEAHVFDRLTNGRFRNSHPNLSSAKWNRALYVGGQGEWGRLHRAMQLDQVAALQSASYGRYQIMGFNYKLAGYGSVDAYVQAMKRSETDQLQAFVTFVISSGLVEELRQISNVHADCVPFARGYNGSGYASHEPGYHIRLARAHKKFVTP